jgi:predicted metal-dependent peptidase
MDAKQKINRMFETIILRTKLNLFAAITYKFKIELVKENKHRACCFIDPATKKPIIQYREDFVEEQEIPQLIYVHLHEIIHFIDGHLSECRYGGKHFETFILACDHVINYMLDKDANDPNALKNIIKAPNDIFRVPALLDKEYTVMEVYEWLMDRTTFIKITPNSNGSSSVEIEGKNCGNVIFDLDPNGEGKSSDQQVQKQVSDELKSELRALINNVIEKSNSKGNVSGKLYEYIKKITEIVVPWYVLLEKAVQTVVTKSDHRSWKNLNKRLRVHNVLIPSHSNEEELDCLYVLQDVSGSVGTADQEKFMSFLLQSINYFKKIVILQHDCELKSKLVLTRQDFESQKEEIFKLKGRGGTSHICVFDEIEYDMFEENVKIGLIVILSDFESNIESIWDKYEFHKEVPIKVLCTSKYQIPTYVDDKPIFIR